MSAKKRALGFAHTPKSSQRVSAKQHGGRPPQVVRHLGTVTELVYRDPDAVAAWRESGSRELDTWLLRACLERRGIIARSRERQEKRLLRAVEAYAALGQRERARRRPPTRPTLVWAWGETGRTARAQTPRKPVPRGQPTDRLGAHLTSVGRATAARPALL